MHKKTAQIGTVQYTKVKSIERIWLIKDNLSEECSEENLMLKYFMMEERLAIWIEGLKREINMDGIKTV